MTRSQACALFSEETCLSGGSECIQEQSRRYESDTVLAQACWFLKHTSVLIVDAYGQEAWHVANPGPIPGGCAPSAFLAGRTTKTKLFRDDERTGFHHGAIHAPGENLIGVRAIRRAIFEFDLI